MLQTLEQTCLESFECMEFGGGPTGFGLPPGCGGPGGLGGPGGGDGNGGPKKPFGEPYMPNYGSPELEQKPFADNWGVNLPEPVSNPDINNFGVAGYCNEQGSNEPFRGNPWEANNPLETMPFENPQLLNEQSNFSKPYLPAYEDFSTPSPLYNKPSVDYGSIIDPVKIQSFDIGYVNPVDPSPVLPKLVDLSPITLNPIELNPMLDNKFTPVDYMKPVDYSPILSEPIELNPVNPILDNKFTPVDYMKPIDFSPVLPKPILSEPIDLGPKFDLPPVINPLNQFDNPLIKSTQVSLLDNEPFQCAYDLPASRVQLHLHGPDMNTITDGAFVDYSRTIKSREKLSGFESAMAALNAENLGFKKIKR